MLWGNREPVETRPDMVKGRPSSGRERAVIAQLIDYVRRQDEAVAGHAGSGGHKGKMPKFSYGKAAARGGVSGESSDGTSSTDGGVDCPDPSTRPCPDRRCPALSTAGYTERIVGR